ncbi:MAG: cobalamin biosynthesis protein P47K [Planctomycetes bacterium]|nr:cobalamin biosynthesis protein P47K [Planctomycetota bacterium]
MAGQAQPVTRFVMLGGFLGAGKTTALLRVAREYTEAGKLVGIITNDQAEGLVDTETFRAQGFDTEEIPKGCFCCKFDELVAAAGRLADGHEPDVLLAEPVGSCTDLVATVINPLKRLYADRFCVAPYVALLDPERAYSALTGTGRAGFSAKVTYIYKMQQNEADVVAINKADTLSPERLQELTELVQRNFPKADVIAISARTGQGFDRLSRILDGAGEAGANPAVVDYDVYAEGEALLGWLNATVDLASRESFDADRFLLALADRIREGLADSGAEPAHVKILLRCGDVVAIANLVRGDQGPELSRRCDRRVNSGQLTINARVEVAPDVLRERVEQALEAVTGDYGLSVDVRSFESLAPPRPVPTHRTKKGVGSL